MPFIELRIKDLEEALDAATIKIELLEQSLADIEKRFNDRLDNLTQADITANTERFHDRIMALVEAADAS